VSAAHRQPVNSRANRRSVALKAARHVRPDRFNPGEWLVCNGLGEVLANSFTTEAEAEAWRDK
jgi:hypothetical protein